MFFAKIAALSALVAATAVDAYSITVKNNCPYTIWPAAYQTDFVPTVKIDAKYTGSKLASGKSTVLQVPNQAMGMRVWGRTGCNADASKCATGTCSGGLLCKDPALTQKVTVAEFGYSSFNNGMTFYDISIIQGNNLGVQIKPSVSTCEVKKCLTSGCAINQAWHTAGDTSKGSPADTGCAIASNFSVTFCPA